MYALVESPVDTEVLQVSQTTVRVLPDNVMRGMLLSHDMLYVIAPVAPVNVGAGMSVLPVPPIVYVAPLAMDDNDLVTGHVMDALGPEPGPGAGAGPGADTVLYGYKYL